MKKLFGIGFAALVLVLFGVSQASRPSDDPDAFTQSTTVSEVLSAYGAGKVEHQSKYQGDSEWIRRGMELVTTGVTTGPNGQETRLQSRYFVCTNCHNIAKEDPDLRVSDPETRFKFVQENGLPFLQATTLYGTVNKESWYNGDYVKKYGDLVKPANKSLREAIQLCATVCSQGRAFEEWEMEAVLAYLWTLEYKLGDLELTAKNMDQLNEGRMKGGPQPDYIKGIKSFYRQGSPATFVEVPEDKGHGYEVARAGDPKMGKELFDASCLRCHNQSGPSNYLKMDHNNLTLGMLRRNIGSRGHLSLYEIIRHGTYADHGHRAYMPNYTAERMSNQQIEDLRAYVEMGPN